MATDSDSPNDLVYGGLFGRLCKHVPLFDARAPGAWTITHRSVRRTMWTHTETGIVLDCGKHHDGWRVTIYDYQARESYQALPQKTSRWKAYDAARQFLEGDEPLLPVAESDWDGVLTLENLQNSR